MLTVPPEVEEFKANRVLIAWKDTREARRAVHDALPVLRHARWVGITEIAEEANKSQALAHIGDVARYLSRHQINVDIKLAKSANGGVADVLIAIAVEEQCDLIVCGAYGHSRIGELIFGGVTRGLLSASPVCCLFSH